MTDETKSVLVKAKSVWRETMFWAILAALLLELVINVSMERTLWHRMAAVEHRLETVEKQLNGEGR